MDDPSEILRTHLNGETGKLGWPELQRYFARGVVIVVTRDLDLVEVAARIAQDDKAAVENWLTQSRMRRATAEDAQDWETRRPSFWAVVTAPWVLVQEVGGTLNS